VSPGGQPTCEPLRATAFSPDWVCTATVGDLKRELEKLPDLYCEWLKGLKLEPDVSASLQRQADAHILACVAAAERMRRSVALLCDESRPEQKAALAAFRLAMKAMALQRRWATGTGLTWHPFQLGFQLVALESLAAPNHP